MLTNFNFGGQWARYDNEAVFEEEMTFVTEINGGLVVVWLAETPEPYGRIEGCPGYNLETLGINAKQSDGRWDLASIVPQVWRLVDGVSA